MLGVTTKLFHSPLFLRKHGILIYNKRNVWNHCKRHYFGKYTPILALSHVSDKAFVPDTIVKPSYAASGDPFPSPVVIDLKTESMIVAMKESCRIARDILDSAGSIIQVGMKTDDLDKLIHKKIIEQNAYPSPLNYRGFPKSVCTSVNNVACHGIPDARPLENGDIVSVDVTVFYKGYHGDCCETFLVGDVDDVGRHLVSSARKCMEEAIKICAPEVPFHRIGEKVEEVAKKHQVSVAPAFTGHGIGTYFHGPPDIYHSYNNYPGTMKSGMTFTVEPVLVQGNKEVIILEDGWTVVTLDNGRAAQFEQTIAITDEGHEVLTASV